MPEEVLPVRPFPFPGGPRPPIFFIFDISALSPSTAMIGDPDFTLTVQGGGFVNGATVTWNGQGRATTFISANQLTAAISAGDVGAVADIPVTVVNPGGAATAAATFSVLPNITDLLNFISQVEQPFTALADFQALQPKLTAAITELRSYITTKDALVSDLQTRLGAAQANVDTLTTQNGTLNGEVTQLTAQNTQLQAQVAAAKNQSASPLEVAQSLKSMFDQVHQSTQAQTGAGVQSSLTNLHMELKTLVNVQRDTPDAAPQALLVFPDPTALPDPAHLSTMQLSFGAVPNLQAGKPAAVTPEPPTPAPTPPTPSTS